MPTTSMIVDLSTPENWPVGRVDFARIDTTTEQDIIRHEREDDLKTRMELAQNARRIRKRLGPTQRELSLRIEVPLDTIRNWEQGKREPAGPAKALLKILDKNPEIALSALES